MRILRRIFAQIIDISLYLAILVVSFIYILPYFSGLFSEQTIPAIIILILSSLITFILQYPFLKVNQTIGKGFFGLKIISTNNERTLDISIILQRELFAKLMSCYIICIPVLFGNKGGHEIATETEVVGK